MASNSNNIHQGSDDNTSGCCCLNDQQRVEKNNRLPPEDYIVEDRCNIPTDHGWAWVVCAGCFLITFVMSLYDQVLAVMFVDVVDKFDVSVTTAAVVFTVYAFTFSIGSIVSTNILIPKYGDRIVIVIAAIINSLSTVIIAFSPNIAFYLTFHLFKGLSIGSMWIPALGLLGHYFRRRRSLATSITNAGISVSLIVAPPFVRVLLDNFGFAGTLLIISGIEMQAIAVGMLLRPPAQYCERRCSNHSHVNNKSKSNEKEQYSLLSKNEEQFDLNHDVTSLTHLTTNSHLQHFDNVVNSPDTLDNSMSTLGSQEQQISMTSYSGKLTSSEVSMDFPTAETSTQIVVASSTPAQLISDNEDSALISNIVIVKRKEFDTGIDYQIQQSPQKSECNTSEIDVQKQQGKQKSSTPHNNSIFYWLSPCKDLLGIFDFKLLGDWLIRLLLASTAFGTLLQYIGAYIPTLAVQKGVDKPSAAMLLTVCGGVNLFSSLLQGIFIDCRLITASKFIAICQITVGTMCHLIHFFTSFQTLLLLSVIHGMFGGARMSLMPVVAMDFVGVKNLSKALGFNAMVATLSLSLHHPFLGYLLEVTNSFDIPFHYVGFALYVSSGLMLMEKCGRTLNNKQQNRENPNVEVTLVIN